MSKYKVKIYNKISEIGLSNLRLNSFRITQSEKDPDAILLRSYDLNDVKLPISLKAIGRAGAGVNNIPVKECTKNGVVVFNTPGANANAVKELVLGSLFLGSRDILGGIEYAKSISSKGDNINQLVESNKSKFKGMEVKGKTLGVIGLGAIGMMVANNAVDLGVNVLGYDPFISINRAWGLSSKVKQALDLKKLLSICDYVSLHTPLTDSTREFFNMALIKHAKEGLKVLNFARPEIVKEKDIIDGLDRSILGAYFTDFPTKKLLNTDNVICMPHIGASTHEAEENCSIMISEQISDYLINGNIVNSVNFPECAIERTTDNRLVIINKNIPNILSQITTLLGSEDLNIYEMVNKSRQEIAYTIVDVGRKPSDELIRKIKMIEGVTSLRLLQK